MLYLVFNEAPSGIFSSQVIDVVDFLNKSGQKRVNLLCLISLRNFFSVRRKIKMEFPGAHVLPMFPTMRLWKMNRFTLYLFLFFSKQEKIMARSVWANWLALKAKKKKLVKKVVYDGRGAVYHESLEYNVIASQALTAELKDIESKCVHESDFLLAVSQKLVEHWQTFYGYAKANFVVIPCTIAVNVTNAHNGNTTSKLFNCENSECVVGVYSGSLAGWQSVYSLREVLGHYFSSNSNFRLLVLSKESPEWTALSKEFPGKMVVMHVFPGQVHGLLRQGDYGFLLRESSVTNSVASPVKFAEYLAAGLKVLVSPGIGDFSEFTVKNKCGIVVSSDSFPVLSKPSLEEKMRLQKIAISCFSKEKFVREYKSILDL